MRILGLDYGEKRIGVAVSDKSRIIAQPYKTIEYNDVREAIENINEICSDKEVALIVVGNPLSMEGKPGTIYKQIMEFIDKLTQSTNIKVVMSDERLSSREAKTKIREMGQQPSRNKEKIDKVSAALILDSYLH